MEHSKSINRLDNGKNAKPTHLEGIFTRKRPEGTQGRLEIRIYPRGSGMKLPTGLERERQRK